VLPQNETEENKHVEINGKTDIVEWICVGGLVVCASLCAFIVFKRRYWSHRGKYCRTLYFYSTFICIFLKDYNI
jgi:hypothetical protein